MKQYYKIPTKDWFRIHFARPRFKNNIESVLLNMATACCRIKEKSCDEFANKLNQSIRLFPGNLTVSEKTINNWRTETPALFSFYVENKKLNITKSTKMAKVLYEKQDLVQFFKQFLFSFQFPGGHVKSNYNIDIIYNNIRFKPAKVILSVLAEGNKMLSSAKRMSISAEEATYCIFNDLNVLTGEKSASDIASTILSNRKNKIAYYDKNDDNIKDNKGKPMSLGDTTRYAGDILDYMVQANLLKENHNYYYLNDLESSIIDIFIKDSSFYHGYDRFYGKTNITTKEISDIEPSWFEYVNNSFDETKFETSISDYFVDDEDFTCMVAEDVFAYLKVGETKAKEIGDIGENIILGHEKMRLKGLKLYDLMKKVQIVDSPSYRPGYDISSYEGDGTMDLRFIEVKTTISHKRIQQYCFHMTEHEWNVSSTIKDHYCVYRLMISDEGKTLYIFRNPVELFRNDMIDCTMNDGMDVEFNPENFKETPIFEWRRN